MKDFIVTVEYWEPTGKRRDKLQIRARNAESAENQAHDVMGIRDGVIISVLEVVRAAEAGDGS